MADLGFVFTAPAVPAIAPPAPESSPPAEATAPEPSFEPGPAEQTESVETETQIAIVNSSDSHKALEALQSPEGEKVVINTIERANEKLTLSEAVAGEFAVSSPEAHDSEKASDSPTVVTSIKETRASKREKMPRAVPSVESVDAYHRYIEACRQRKVALAQWNGYVSLMYSEWQRIRANDIR